MTTPHDMFVSHSSLTVGAERSVLALAEAAHRRGEHVTAVLPRPGPLEPLLREAVPGITVHHCPMQWWMGVDHRGTRGVLKLGQSVLHVLPWLRLLRRTRPRRLIIGSTVTPAPVIAGRLLGIPVVVLLSESIATNPTLASVVPKAAIIRTLKACATVTVAVSEFVAEQFRGATFVEPPAILDEPEPEPAPERSGPPSGRLVMLGTLSAEKGQLDAVQAVRILTDRGVEVTLDLYGGSHPSDLTALRTRIAEFGVEPRVTHRGETGDPLAVLRDADISLVCSRNEAYGRVTAESLLVGTPVVGYRRGGTAEIVEDGGGVLVEPTPQALADAVQHLLTDETAYRNARSAALDRSRTRKGFGDADRTLDRIDAALAG